MNPYLFLLLKRLLELEIEMIQIQIRDQLSKDKKGKNNPNNVRIADIEQAIKNAGINGGTTLPKKFKTCAESIRKEWSRKDLKLSVTCLDIIVRLLEFFGPYKDWDDFEEKNKHHTYALRFDFFRDKSFWQLLPTQRFDAKIFAEKRAAELVTAIKGYGKRLFDSSENKEEQKIKTREEFYRDFLPSNKQLEKDLREKFQYEVFGTNYPTAENLTVIGLKFYALQEWFEWDVLVRERSENNF